MLLKVTRNSRMPADFLPGALCIPLPASPGSTVSQADLDGKQVRLHPGGSLPGGRQVDPQGQLGGSAPLSSISQHPHPLISAQGSSSESLDLSPGAPGFDWSVPPWQPRGHPACPSGRLSPALGLAGTSLCLMGCHSLSPHVSSGGRIPIKGGLPMSFPPCTVYRASGTEWAQRLPCWNSSESRGQGAGQMV